MASLPTPLSPPPPCMFRPIAPRFAGQDEADADAPRRLTSRTGAASIRRESIATGSIAYDVPHRRRAAIVAPSRCRRAKRRSEAASWPPPATISAWSRARPMPGSRIERAAFYRGDDAALAAMTASARARYLCDRRRACGAQEARRGTRSAVFAGRGARVRRRARHRVSRADGRSAALRRRPRSGRGRAPEGARRSRSSSICAPSRCRRSSLPSMCRRWRKPRRCSAGMPAIASAPIAAR